MAATCACAISPLGVGGDGQVPCQYDTVTIPPLDLPGGGDTVYIEDVNDVGEGVGFIKASISRWPCHWSSSGGLTLLPPSGLSDPTGRLINNNGWIVVTGYKADNLSAVVYIPFENGYGLVPINPAVPWGNLQASGINDSNVIVGGLQFGDERHPDWAGFRWTLAGGTELYQVPGWNATICVDVNNSGMIAGNVGTSSASVLDPNVRAFVAMSDNVTILVPPPPWTRTYAAAINNLGMVAGGIWKAAAGPIPSQYLGWLASPGSASFTIISGPNGATRWNIRDINDAGVACGGAVEPNVPCIAASGVAAALAGFVAPGTFVGDEARAITSSGEVFTHHQVNTIRFLPMGGGADLDCDGKVGPADLAIVLDSWNGASLGADLTGDGKVDGADLGAILSAWTS